MDKVKANVERDQAQGRDDLAHKLEAVPQARAFDVIDQSQKKNKASSQHHAAQGRKRSRMELGRGASKGETKRHPERHRQSSEVRRGLLVCFYVGYRMVEDAEG